MKTWAQICKQLQACLHRLSENTKTSITFLKKKRIINLIFLNNNLGRALDNRAGRSALRNMPSRNTVYITFLAKPGSLCEVVRPPRKKPFYSAVAYHHDIKDIFAGTESSARPRRSLRKTKCSLYPSPMQAIHPPRVNAIIYFADWPFSIYLF